MNAVNVLFKLLSDPKISLVKTLYFNMHYFPIKMAIKLPVVVFKKVIFKAAKGKVVLNSSIKHGMVYLGRDYYGFQTPKDYTIWQQTGGEIIFEENITIGNGSFISIGKNGSLKIERCTLIGNAKIICFKSIIIKKNTRISWDVTVLDTDFHECINIKTKERNIASKEIIIGENNWIGFGCSILKGTATPDYCIIAAKSLTNKNYAEEGNYIVLGSNASKVCSKDIYRDLNSVVE